MKSIYEFRSSFFLVWYKDYWCILNQDSLLVCRCINKKIYMFMTPKNICCSIISLKCFSLCFVQFQSSNYLVLCRMFVCFHIQRDESCFSVTRKCVFCGTVNILKSGEVLKSSPAFLSVGSFLHLLLSVRTTSSLFFPAVHAVLLLRFPTPHRVSRRRETASPVASVFLVGDIMFSRCRKKTKG